MSRDVDPEPVRLDFKRLTKSKKDARNPGLAHETLSVALLSAHADLLLKFKGDHSILRNLTLNLYVSAIAVCVLQSNLILFVVASVLSLQQCKEDFSNIVKNVSDIYRESSDEGVLANAALSLASLTRGGHARVHLATGCIVLERTSLGIVGRRT